MPRRLLTGATTAALLLLGACGGQPISPGASDVPEAAGSGSASTVPELSSATRSGPLPVRAPASSGALGGGGVRGGVFCRDLAEQLSALPDILGKANTPGNLSGAVRQARQTNARILRDAPAAIRGDVQTLVALSNRILDDVTASPPRVQDVAGVVADSRYRAAAVNVNRYATAHCGSIPPTPSP